MLEKDKEIYFFDTVVFLAIFNGQKYLAKQIDSLLQQSYDDFKIIVHDDGSTDDSIRILEYYVNHYPGKFLWLNDGVKTGSARNNFFYMLEMFSFKYAFFCDQDDVWDVDKVELYLDRFESDEIPTVVFSDLEVVDENLKTISRSMWDYQNTGPYLAESIKLLATRNPVTGCAMAINYAAKTTVYSVSDMSNVVMHDWFIAILVKFKLGRLISIDKPLVKYRQHVSNEVGAQKFSIYSMISKLLHIRAFVTKQYSIYRMSKVLNIFPNFFYFLAFKIKSLIKK